MFLFYQNFLHVAITAYYDVQATLQVVHADSVKVVDTCGNLLRSHAHVLYTVGIFLVELIEQLL